MTSSNIFPILFLMASMLFANCSNDAPVSDVSQQQSPAAIPAAPSPDTSSLTTPSSDTSSSATSSSDDTPSPATPLPAPTVQPGEKPADMTGKAAPRNPSDHEVRSAARPSDKVVKHNSPFKSTTTAVAKKENPVGNPTGYIGRANIVFYGAPSTTAEKLSTLKINESVILLETKMTDETGKTFDMPQWYKVQLSNKKIGWVIGSSVTIN